MGNAHKVTHEDQTPSEIIKKKQQIQFLEKDYIREVEGDIEYEYQILSPPLVSNDFYQLRKAIYKQTKLCKTMFIINKYKVRTQQREFLQQQIEKLKKIDNPYLLKIYELHRDKHRFYIICQFCYGQSLAEILMQEGFISQRKAALIMHQLLNVLRECHKNNIVHSDLKLQNLTFNSNDQDVIKITDFSISRIFRIQDVITQSRRKAFLAAPQTLNGQPLPQSDIWSCGIILYIILSGQIPIVGASIKKLRQKMLYYSPSFLHQRFRYISNEAKKLIKLMLNQKPQLRPSAQECLKHSWFAKFYQTPLLSDSIFKKILFEGFNFNPSSKLQEATWGLYVNAFISFDEKQSILYAFSRLDKQSKNFLTCEDLKDGFILFQDEETADFLSRFIYHRHRDKCIRFSEFVAMCVNRTFLINNQNTKNLFKIFDQDESGQIQLNQVRTVLGASKQLPQQIWVQLMKQADENSDGVISFQEFTHMMNQLKNNNNERHLKRDKIQIFDI